MAVTVVVDVYVVVLDVIVVSVVVVSTALNLQRGPASFDPEHLVPVWTNTSPSVPGPLPKLNPPLQSHSGSSFSVGVVVATVVVVKVAEVVVAVAAAVAVVVVVIVTVVSVVAVVGKKHVLHDGELSVLVIPNSA